jgi:hypothetical protein
LKLRVLRLAQQWTSLHLGDYIAYYLAWLWRGSTPVMAIEDLKLRLREAGGIGRVRLGSNRRLPPVWLGGGGLALGLLIVAAWLPVVSSLPSANSRHVGSMSPLRLTFSRPMDQASVELRLSVDRACRGAWSGWEHALVLSPAALATDGSVQVRLAPFARSAQLPPMLRNDVDLLVDPARVIYLWPANGTAQLYALDPISGDRQFWLGLRRGRRLRRQHPRGAAGVRRAAAGRQSIFANWISPAARTRWCTPAEGIRYQALDLDPAGKRLAFEKSSWVTGAGGRQIPGKQIAGTRAAVAGRPHAPGACRA